ncbi:MAG: hypothetical protein V3T08_10010 [Gemmatimonadota bacterium]
MGWSGANQIVSRVARVAKETDNKFPTQDGYMVSRDLLTELVKACLDQDADNLCELEGEFWLLDEVLRSEEILE